MIDPLSDPHEALTFHDLANDQDPCPGCRHNVRCRTPKCGRLAQDAKKRKDAIAEQPSRHELQAKGEHPAPCARFCEANAFQIAERRYKRQIEELTAKVMELERLCDDTYVAQGADAYNHACDEMERWQEQRKLAGKDPGTEGSLCDGISWLYSYIDKLEARQ